MKRASTGAYTALLEQRRHLVDAAIARRVHLDIVDEAPVVDFAARTAHAARRGRSRRFSQLSALAKMRDERGLADAARAGEQIGMMQAAAVERVRERTHDVLLADERREILRPPFACENLIGHAEIVSVTMPRKTESNDARTAVPASLKQAKKRIEKNGRSVEWQS